MKNQRLVTVRMCLVELILRKEHCRSCYSVQLVYTCSSKTCILYNLCMLCKRLNYEYVYTCMCVARGGWNVNLLTCVLRKQSMCGMYLECTRVLARVADEMSNEVHFAWISLTRQKEVKLATGL